MAENVMTIKQYLNGKVRNITVPDDAISTFIMDAGCTTVDVEKDVTGEDTGESSVTTEQEQVTPDTDVTLLSTRERELCLAWMYVWVAGSPTQTGSNTEEDADWKHTEGGERMSAGVLKQYLSMANDIFNKYDLPLVGEEDWGFVGRGIHNPRKYR